MLFYPKPIIVIKNRGLMKKVINFTIVVVLISIVVILGISFVGCKQTAQETNKADTQKGGITIVTTPDGKEHVQIGNGNGNGIKWTSEPSQWSNG